MRILFSILRPTVLKNFESVIRSLAARGHEVELVIHTRIKDPRLGELIPSLTAERGVTLVKAPAIASDTRVIRRTAAVRSSLDYLRYIEPRYPGDEMARAGKAPQLTRFGARLPFLRTPRGRRVLRKALVAVDRTVRPTPGLVRFLERRRPDIVLLTPYVDQRIPPQPVDYVQPDLLRAAQRLRIPTVVCVASWDHLTLKSSLWPRPDRALVWNEIQRREADELHGLSPELVVVTGAQCYDEWFGWTPRPRDEFCARAGLDPERPYVLYTCLVSPRNGPSEVTFVLSWLDALRAHPDPAVSGVGVLVRPHPGRTETWQDVDLSAYGNAVLFPRDPGFPTTVREKSDYFDSIYHSKAVVGLNTSAMLEAAIIRRPVFTILVPEFEKYQMDKPHFRYLREVAGGVVHASQGLAEHVELLRRALGEDGSGWRRDEAAFVHEFLRPHGLDVEATPIFVDEIEKVAHGRNVAAAQRRSESAPLGWAR
jgi:hypothetical protein